jgi:SEFIR domain-containing protein
MESVRAAPPQIFISYSHDSLEHNDRVLGLADRLRADGIDARIDQYESAPPEGWTRWMRNEIRRATFVLIICSEAYQRRAEGNEESGKGRGANREGLIIDQAIYDSDGTNEKFIAVILRHTDNVFIPDFLRPYESESTETEDGYEKLYRRLTNQHDVVKRQLGRLRSLPLRERKPYATARPPATIPVGDLERQVADHTVPQRAKQLEVARWSTLRHWRTRVAEAFRSHLYLAVSIALIVTVVAVAYVGWILGQPLPSDEDPYKRLRSPAENQVIDTMDKIVNLRQFLETAKRYPDSRVKLQPAKDLADLITSIPDTDLNPTRRYIKREYGAFAYIMAAVAADDDPVQYRALCMRAIVNCKEALSLFDEARRQYQKNPQNRNAKLLFEWVPEDQSDDRTLYYEAEALCMISNAENDRELKRQARETWNRIHASYRQLFPAKGTDDLAGCIVDEAK